MIKDLDSICSSDKLMLFLHGTISAVEATSKDYKNYQLYKDNSEEFIGSKSEMEILSTLEKLGFPMDEMGTYLYKNVVARLIPRLSRVETKDDIVDCKETLLSLKDGFSQFYFDLSRNELDFGVKAFHKCIETSIEKVDFDIADPEVLKKVFANIRSSVDYGELAFIIAAYETNKLQEMKETYSINKPIIKKLCNVPTVYLKDNL